MRFLINKVFHKQLRHHDLDQNYLKSLIDDIFRGRSEFLGAKLYKIRAAREGGGKSGGFRNIFFWKKGELIIFCFLFPKNVQENISDREMKALRLLSREYSNLTVEEIKQEIENKNFEIIDYEEHEH